MRRLGVHVSISGGLPGAVEHAVALGCTTMQIFSHNPRGWAVKRREPGECVTFRKLREKRDIRPVFIHCSYLINLATGNPVLREKSIDLLIAEMDIADSLGAEYLVLHSGSASGEAPETARKRVLTCLRRVSRGGKWKCGILLENTAGERGDVGSTIEEISSLLENSPGSLIAGLCLDSCHAFAAGYNIGAGEDSKVLSDGIRRAMGEGAIKLIHLNDSKGELGSGVDRHEHIGKGKIGLEGLRHFLDFPDFLGVPLILETPKKSDTDDLNNLAAARSLSCPEVFNIKQ